MDRMKVISIDFKTGDAKVSKEEATFKEFGN